MPPRTQAPESGSPSANSIPGPAHGPAVESAWLPITAIMVVAAALFALRVAGPPNLLVQDQERPAAYVLDAVKNGNWVCQRDVSGEITSKPPLWTWLSALTTLVCGRISIFSLYLPGALGAAGAALLVWAFGRARFGERAAVVGAAAVMLSTAGLKWFGLARTDGVFAFTVTASALLAYWAWERGGGWTWAWGMAAVATLTKGPLGPVLAGAGLLAAAWQPREAPNRLPVAGAHLPGITLFLLVTTGWFCAAWLACGQALIDKMMGKELVGHAVASGTHWPGSLFWQPPLYYLGRAAPWSLLACYGLYRIWKAPAQQPDERRFERFLFCWFGLGLLLFSMAPHQRADLLWPIMPAGALIAGRELARLTSRIPAATFYRWFGLIVALTVIGFAVRYLGPRAEQTSIRQTLFVKQLAAEVERSGGAEFPLTHADDCLTLQIYLNTLRPPVSLDRAAQLLRGPEAAFIAVADARGLERCRKPDDPPWHRLLETGRAQQHGVVALIGNRPGLVAGDTWAFCFGSLLVRSKGLNLRAATQREFVFTARSNHPTAIILNESRAPRLVRLRFLRDSGEIKRERVLSGGEAWETAF